jgi:hypothetical protein
METTPFDLMPEPKDLLKSLSEEIGKPISALLTAALEGLGDFLKRIILLCCRRRLLTSKIGLGKPSKENQPARIYTFPEIA